MGLGTSPWTSNRYTYGAGNPTTNIENDGHIVCQKPDGIDCGMLQADQRVDSGADTGISVTYGNGTTLDDDHNGTVIIDGDYELPDGAPERAGDLAAKVDEIKALLGPKQLAYVNTIELVADACASEEGLCSDPFTTAVDLAASASADQEECDGILCVAASVGGFAPGGGSFKGGFGRAPAKRSGMRRGASALRGVSLPRQIEGIDMGHVRDNHMVGGKGVKPDKGVWPKSMSEKDIESFIRQAYNNNPKIVGYDHCGL